MKKGRNIETVISVNSSGAPRVIWKWQPKGTEEFRNSPISDAAWRNETVQIQMEETRLLYVAMTRAKENLIVFVRTDSKKGTAETSKSETWGDLIRNGAQL